jgi:sulfoquinovosyltransferase
MLRRAFNPDVIHCSSPGIMWLAALIYSRLLKAPLVYSYHTHVPEYMPRWGWILCSGPARPAGMLLV